MRGGACVASACLGMAAALISALLASATPLSAAELGKADKILVLKSQRQLLLQRDGVTLKAYPIALGFHPVAPKHRQGDGKTPEGIYVIDGRLDRTPYHLALHISYPNEADRAYARAAHVSPGGEILIHGMPARFGHTDPVKFFKDWTDGCISVGNIAIEEIWAAVDDGTPVEIRP
ncbi:MAG TPA: L,D-transpeptidase family protein [Aliidongia sp.]|nr:L,D-transpeptidase family protein [Aliidongia sp.]